MFCKNWGLRNLLKSLRKTGFTHRNSNPYNKFIVDNRKCTFATHLRNNFSKSNISWECISAENSVWAHFSRYTSSASFFYSLYLNIETHVVRRYTYTDLSLITCHSKLYWRMIKQKDLSHYYKNWYTTCIAMV